MNRCQTPSLPARGPLKSRANRAATAGPLAGRGLPSGFGWRLGAVALLLASVGAIIGMLGGSASHDGAHAVLGQRSAVQAATRPRGMRGAVGVNRCAPPRGGVWVSEATGPFHAIAYFGLREAGICVSGSGTYAFSTVPVPVAVEPAFGKIQRYVLQIRSPDGVRLFALYGRVGAGVTAIRLRLKHEPSITAAVHDRWYLASWLVRAQVTGIETTSRSGVRLLALPAAARSRALSCRSRQGCAVTGQAGA